MYIVAMKKSYNAVRFVALLSIVTFLSACQGNPDGKDNQGTWSFDGESWQSSGTPSNCLDPLTIPSPVDMNLASAILYPGQYRGSDYKPHGGIRFESKSNEVAVTVPLDAEIYKASRYIESGEIQYLFFFINSCGIMYKFDHLLTLSPTFQVIADSLPEAKQDDSRTTNLDPMPSVKAGDAVATAVGLSSSNNVFLDFGVYDLRSKNKAYEIESWKIEHQADKEMAPYGICWLDYLSGDAKSISKALPGGDGKSGKTSDYCQ